MYGPTHSARFVPDTLEDHCRSSHIGRQTGEIPCGLHLTFPSTDRRGPDRLIQREGI